MRVASKGRAGGQKSENRSESLVYFVTQAYASLIFIRFFLSLVILERERGNDKPTHTKVRARALLSPRPGIATEVTSRYHDVPMRARMCALVSPCPGIATKVTSRHRGVPGCTRTCALASPCPGIGTEVTSRYHGVPSRVPMCALVSPCQGIAIEVKSRKSRRSKVHACACALVSPHPGVATEVTSRHHGVPRRTRASASVISSTYNVR